MPPTNGDFLSMFPIKLSEDKVNLSNKWSFTVNATLLLVKVFEDKDNTPKE